MERATISRQQQTQRAFLGAALMDPARAREYIIKLVPGMLKANRTILMDNGPRQFHLRDALKCVAGDYDYCIMDCPPDLDMGSINALCAADWVIIPVDCDKRA